MAKDNAQIQREKRPKEKAPLDTIGAEKRSLIVSKALAPTVAVKRKAGALSKIGNVNFIMELEIQEGALQLCSS